MDVVDQVMGGNLMISKKDAVQKRSNSGLDNLRAFMKLPLQDRRRILSEQASLLEEDYEAEPELIEREQRQGGDVIEVLADHIRSKLRYGGQV
jgi:hypothetical protein